jgi:hypothetical protein
MTGRTRGRERRADCVNHSAAAKALDRWRDRGRAQNLID